MENNNSMPKAPETNVGSSPKPASMGATVPSNVGGGNKIEGIKQSKTNIGNPNGGFTNASEPKAPAIDKVPKVESKLSKMGFGPENNVGNIKPVDEDFERSWGPQNNKTANKLAKKLGISDENTITDIESMLDTDMSIEDIEKEYGNNSEEPDFDKDILDAYNKTGGDQDAMLDILRQKDYGMSNGDLQGIVEVYQPPVNKKLNNMGFGDDKIVEKNRGN